MTTETGTYRSRFFVTSLLPWLVAGGMLLVYLLTQNHLPNANSIYRISELSGWYSPRRYFAPLTYLLTYPLRWLPAALIGTGLNLFTAVCAALTLALLARSVALLPHDRTYDQRLREFNEFSILTIPVAWLPPLFAALVCGLQMTFWENSTNSAGQSPELATFATDAAGQMLDLLLFAYCIRCLLEYRITLKDSWVARFAFVYGLGMADTWLMIGLFPGFLAALIWIRGINFFNPRLLGILAICGLVGFSLILFFPILTALKHLPDFGFWDSLHYIQRADKSFITALPRELLLLLSLTSLLPVFIIGIRWASYFGDTSQVGIFLATFTFHAVHAVFFMACIWVAFDPPFSPRQKAYNLPLLQLYYLGALSIGYFAGYFLLVFGVTPSKTRRRQPAILQFINFAVVAFVWVLAFAVPVFQFWKNLPQLRATQSADAAFARFTSLTAQCLPKQACVLLSDDRVRLLLLEHHFGRGAGATKHLFLDTGLLNKEPTYLRQLEKENPDFALAGYFTNTAVKPSDFEKIHFLVELGKKHDIYYIHPSFGYFFERFYAEPDGLSYQLKDYDTNTWKKPLLTVEQIQQNQKIWESINENELPVLTNLLGQTKHPVSSPILQYVMDTGHLTVETNKTAELLGSYYARSLDYWGVELEKAALLPEAGKCFEEARLLNPGSVAARVNAQFNQDLRAGKKIVIQPPAAVRDSFGRFRTWPALLNSDGPFDDPSFCYVLGETFAAGEDYHEGAPVPRRSGNYLQAIQQFERVRVLAPDYPNAGYWLCKLFLRFGKNSEALTNAEQLLQLSPDDPEALFNKAVALMQLGSYDKALEPLGRLLAAQKDNYFAVMERAICHLQLHDYAAAKADYEALARVDPKVSQIESHRIDFGLQEIAYQQKDTNSLVKYLELYLTNYYQLFPTNYTPPETGEVKLIKQRLKEFKTGAP